MATPTERIRDELSEGKVIIGKHIPTHWGDRRLISWHITDNKSLAMIGMHVGYDTMTDAINEYFKNRDYYDRYTQGEIVIVPEYEYSGALMNPRVMAWREAVNPFTRRNAGMT